jgi:hypothetical protein
MIKRIGEVLTVVALFGLSGCGSTSEAEGAPASASSTPPDDAVAPAPQTTTAEIGGVLDGSWGAFPPDGIILLDISGHKVVMRGGGHRCEGSVAKENEHLTVRLKCNDPQEKRTVGTIWGLTETGMTVEWKGYGADSFRHATPEDSDA